MFSLGGVRQVLLHALHGGLRKAYVVRNGQQISPTTSQHVETLDDPKIQNIPLCRTQSPSQTS